MLDDELLASHLQELRRGTVVLACLLILRRPDYGYALLDRLERGGFAVDANTLYPLLRRLEKQGLLTSDWNTEESRPRKFRSTCAHLLRPSDAARRRNLARCRIPRPVALGTAESQGQGRRSWAPARVMREQRPASDAVRANVVICCNSVWRTVS